MKLVAPYVLCGLLMLLAVPVLAQSETDARPGTFIGTIISVKSRKPAADVVVIATSPTIYGERSALTDEHGNYRLTHLPPGTYTLRFEHPDYDVYERADIQLRPARTVRVKVELLERPSVLEELSVRK
ncbi:carboxypeptidase-like regulatory domain-containing protein [Pyxidicoccus sp. 3LG]